MGANPHSSKKHGQKLASKQEALNGEIRRALSLQLGNGEFFDAFSDGDFRMKIVMRGDVVTLNLWAMYPDDETGEVSETLLKEEQNSREDALDGILDKLRNFDGISVKINKNGGEALTGNLRAFVMALNSLFEKNGEDKITNPSLITNQLGR
jgi:hypothetical protein